MANPKKPRITSTSDALLYAIRELRLQVHEHENVDQLEEAEDCADVADILEKLHAQLKTLVTLL